MKNSMKPICKHQHELDKEWLVLLTIARMKGIRAHELAQFIKEKSNKTI
ncbi:hypothetical protein [Gracilibacillus salinarum]|uniref:DNA-binding anti-repressor SinI n=1 Tax=Gracilibacillus salinarum TaxID=2932255 RepID=A0ABY4GGP6_9BACI|nr:hypothetical protein [Gracilibacillus salinarum]UOQ83385.1 hypothetical protein MUN87_11475 [Gracilibacillus salinarum]